MAYQCVHSGLTYKMEVEIDAHHAAAVADGAELVIRQIAAVTAETAGVGVGGDDCPLPHLHQVPKAPVREMGHIGIDVIAVEFTDKCTTLFAETALRLGNVAAAEDIGAIPHGIENAHALLGHRFDL